MAANLFVIHGWIPSVNNNVVLGGWSIAVGMSFYLFAPLFIYFLSKIPGGVALISATVAVGLIFTNYLFNGAIKNTKFEHFGLLINCLFFYGPFACTH